MKKILVILDGAADLSVNVFGGKTPLEYADTPNLDELAREGRLGYMYSIDENTIPGSDNALISIFGNDPKKCKRGFYEALGAGFELKKGDLAVRTNFGSIENLKTKNILDRRAGRTLTTKEAEILADAISEGVKLDCKFEFKSTFEHRGVLVLRGNFSDNITDVDPEWNGKGRIKDNKVKFSDPLDDQETSIYTANILNNFLNQAFSILDNHPVNHERKRKGLFPANFLFTRGASSEIPKIKSYKNWMSVNSMPLEVGIAKASKMKNFSFELPKLKSIDAYKHLYEKLDKEIKFSKKKIKKNRKNFVGCYIHFKECDLPGHDNKPYEKKNMLEIIDEDFFKGIKKFLDDNGIMLVVTCDHATPCRLRGHSSDPVPVLVYNGRDKDNTSHFSEREAKRGGLGKIYGRNLFKKTGLDK